MDIYLAGAIRDGVAEDIEWRERLIREVRVPGVRFLNPLGGKTYDPVTKAWSMSGIVPAAKVIVKHDFWCIDRVDAVIFNFRALTQKYPNIGTLVEFGRATAHAPRCLIYAIIDPEYTGHENVALFRLHPFPEENCSVIFPTVDECVDFMKHHLRVLTGGAPNFCGYVGQPSAGGVPA